MEEEGGLKDCMFIRECEGLTNYAVPSYVEENGTRLLIVENGRMKWVFMKEC